MLSSGDVDWSDSFWSSAIGAALHGRTWGHVEIARERLRDVPTKPKAGTLALPWSTE